MILDNADEREPSTMEGEKRMLRYAASIGIIVAILGSANASSQADSTCSVDTANLATTDYVARARTVMGLKDINVLFLLCDSTGFLTKRSPSGTVYTIRYPTLDDARRYKAPIIHELAHVLQLERSGGMSALSQSLNGSTPRIELGADFLAGVVYKRLWPTDDDTFEYQSDVQLLGSYHLEDAERHGTPADRNSAFRLGYFLNDRKVDDLWLDHQYFQSKLFSQFMQKET